MPFDPPPVADLRSLVRDVLRETLERRGRASMPEAVSISNDSELAAFVRLLITRLDDPVTGPAIRHGQYRFRLAAAPCPAAGSAGRPQNPANGPHLEGVITERRIDRLAKGGTLVLAPGAVLTPLARDRARKLGLKIERSR
jgi:hypothetical protein